MVSAVTGLIGVILSNHQRPGAISNAHEGRVFEGKARSYFIQNNGWDLVPNLSVAISVNNSPPKKHRFDLGSQERKIIVECKSHNWTESGNVPSAKITVWNEAMYYFLLAPEDFRKILFVLEAHNEKRGLTLAQYYVRNYGHLIPQDVEILEFNEKTGLARTVERA